MPVRRFGATKRRGTTITTIAITLLLIASGWQSLTAQTTTISQLQWDIIGAIPAEVQTYTTAVTLNGVAITTPPTCVAKGTMDTTCSVAAPNIDQVGPNTLSIINAKGDWVAEMKVTGLKIAPGLRTASRPRVNIVVTINVP